MSQQPQGKGPREKESDEVSGVPLAKRPKRPAGPITLADPKASIDNQVFTAARGQVPNEGMRAIVTATSREERSKYFDKRLIRKQRLRRGGHFYARGEVQKAAEVREGRLRMVRAAEVEVKTRLIGRIGDKQPKVPQLVNAAVIEVEGEGLDNIAGDDDLEGTPEGGVEWWDRDVLVHGVVTVVPVEPGPCTSPITLPPRELPKTPAELKKERMQRRKQRTLERRRAIQNGESKQAPPRLTIDNIRAVLENNNRRAGKKNQPLPDPTTLEQMVNEDLDRRMSNHEARNATNKLSKEDRSKKKREKHEREAEEGLTLTAFRVALTCADLKKDIWSVTTNATQLHITGAFVRVGLFGLILVEGGRKPTSKMDSLITRRIPEQQKKRNDSAKDWGGVRVFHGSVTTHRFEDFADREFSDEALAMAYLKDRRCDGFWDTAKQVGNEASLHTVL